MLKTAIVLVAALSMSTLANAGETTLYTCSQILNGNTDSAVYTVASGTITISRESPTTDSVSARLKDQNGNDIALRPYDGFGGDSTLASADPDKCYNVGPMLEDTQKLSIASPCLNTIEDGRGSYRSNNSVVFDKATSTVQLTSSLRMCENDFFGNCSALHGPFVTQVAVKMACVAQAQ